MATQSSTAAFTFAHSSWGTQFLTQAHLGSNSREKLCKRLVTDVCAHLRCGKKKAKGCYWLSAKDSRERSNKAKCSEEDEDSSSLSKRASTSEKSEVGRIVDSDASTRSSTKKNSTEEAEAIGDNRDQAEDALASLQADIPVIRQIFGADTFFPTEDVVGKRGVVYRGNLRNKPDEVYQRLSKRLEALLGEKYALSLLEGDESGRAFILIEPSTNWSRSRSENLKNMHKWRENVFTFTLAMVFCVLTATTVYMRVGTILGPEYGELRRVTFANGLKPVFMGIFLNMSVAQLLHRLTAWRYRCSTSAPIMLPSPQLGTFGSVYYLDKSPPDRTALFDIAMAGSAFPFIVSILVFSVGTILTTFAVGLPLSSVGSSMTSVQNYVYVPVQWIYRDSLLLGMIARALLHVEPVTRSLTTAAGQNLAPLVLVHPLVLVGACLVQISALSLLPLRQLDGWRILAAIFGRRAAGFLSRFTVLYLLLGATRYPYLLMFLAVTLFGPWKVDRQCRNEVSEPSNVRLVHGYIMIVLMIFAMCPFSRH
jgi:hypothetical protein